MNYAKLPNLEKKNSKKSQRPTQSKCGTEILDIISERTEDHTETSRDELAEDEDDEIADDDITQLSLSIQTKYEYVFEPDANIKQLKAKQIFDRIFNDHEAKLYVPEIDEIEQFCQNIILMAKMEKEIAIICLVYLEKIMVKMGIFVTPFNWRRLVLISMILGSKIWDDESFENDNFATVFSKYSTEDINEMERMFIERIDYDLEIPTAEYTKYYIILRRFARREKRGKNLRALDVHTVIKLQSGDTSSKGETLSKFRDPVNKSFTVV